MLMEDRTLEMLVERFAEACASEYSVTEDRSRQIADYVAGKTEDFPDLLEQSNYYSYRTMGALEKLSKKDDSDILFRAAAIVLRTGTESNRYYWNLRAFPIVLGKEAEPLGLSGDSKLGSQRLEAILLRLRKLIRYAGIEPVVLEIRSTLRSCGFGTKNLGGVGEVYSLLLHLALLRELDEDVAKQESKSLPELLRALLEQDEARLEQELRRLIEPMLRYSLPHKDNISALDLNASILQSRRERAIADYMSGEQGECEQPTRDQFNEAMLTIHSALFFVMNMAGGSSRLLQEPGVIGSLLLHAVRILHEVYPLEVRAYLLTLERSATRNDKALTGVVPLGEPFGLIEQLLQELNSYYVSWGVLRAAIASEPEQSMRAFELVSHPFLRLYLRKELDEMQIEMPEGTPTVEELVYELLRDKRHGAKYGLFWARYLQGEMTAEEYLQDNNNKHLFYERHQDRKRPFLFIATSFLSIDSEPYRRLAIILPKLQELAAQAFALLYKGDQFSATRMLERYGDDPEVDRDRLLGMLFRLHGQQGYTSGPMSDEEFRGLVKGYVSEAISCYKELSVDSRLLLLETVFEAREEIATDLLVEIVRQGLADSSKKAKQLAAAELGAAASHDPRLYVELYRREKKAGVRELVLHVIRKLPDSKSLYTELLSTEKSEEFRAMIQTLLDTADSSPAQAHAAIADVTDGKKLARIGWLSLDDLPDLLDVNGEALDPRIKKYVLTQAMEHTTAPNEQLLELRQYASSNSLARFAVELVQLWLSHDAPAKEKWVLYIGALFGDRSLSDLLGAQIKYWADNSRGAIAAEAVRALAYLQEPAALLAIDKIKRTVKNKQVKGAAEEALLQAAEAQGLTTEQLEDRLITSLGFDSRGVQTLSYGERSFQVKVSRDLQVVIVNEETGKTMKSLPAPGAKDDAELAAQSKSRLTQLKKDLKAMAALQSQRLEESLSKQRLWSSEEWTELFVRNMIMQQFAVGLIWGVYEGGKPTDTFRYMEDGSFNTVDEDEYELADGVMIGLVHPLELDKQTLEAWKSQLEDYEIKQPFEQLNRMIYLVGEEEQEAKEYKQLPGEDFSPTAFPKALEKYGWYKGMAQDAGTYYELYKDYGELIAELRISGTSISYYEGIEDITLESVHFYPNRHNKYHYYDPSQAIAFNRIPGRVFSETVYDIMRAAGR